MAHRLHEESRKPSIVEGSDDDFESSVDEDDIKENNAPAAPQHASLQCTCPGRKGTKKDESDPLSLTLCASLPNELKMKILEKCDVETLVIVDLQLPLLRQVVHLPKEFQTETSWLANYVAKENSGILYIPENSRFSLYNHQYDSLYDSYEEEFNPRKSGKRFPFEMGEMKPVSEPGFYKVRILKHGFDLVKVGYHFISTQCGPTECFPEEDESNWASSYISRGFEIETEWRCDLAPGIYNPERSWTLLISPEKLNAPAFLISFGEECWSPSWGFEQIRPYSVDEVAQTNYRGVKCERSLTVHVMKTKDGQVKGYKISGDCLAAYDPVDEPHSDEGWYEFSVTRYKYKGMKKEIGFVITGSQNEYGMPALLDEIDQTFPDKKYFKRKERKKWYVNI